MHIKCAVLCAAVCLIAGWVQAADLPHIGYVYPAGGQQGHEVVIAAGGQFLRQPQAAYVTGEGVKAKIIQWCPQVFNLNKDERDIIFEKLIEVRNKRLSERGLPARPAPGFMLYQKDKSNTKVQGKKTDNKIEQRVMQMALLYDIDNKSLRELAHITEMLMMPRTKLQQNRQISETVLIKLIIDADAAPGTRELRIFTALGLTNPMIIHVGQFGEFIEMEPNDRDAFPESVGRMQNLPAEKPLTLPFTANGQLMPGDVDRFRFAAEAGQKLVIRTDARSLVPYLADAVPGWLQATVALYDSNGSEIAFADDYRFNPDPVMYYEIPKTGEYELSIRDSIYRGRQDFVYRVTAGELPFITQMFPLGTREGDKTTASIDGWNLADKSLKLDSEAGKGTVRRAVYENGGKFSNPVLYAVDTLMQFNEAESNDTIFSAQAVTFPAAINGQINKKEDTDVFKFQGHAGDEIVAEVYARRLNSPMDSLLRLMDSLGKVIEFNDDYMVKDAEYLFQNFEGLLTHHADSYLTAKLPADGTYYLQVSDSQHAGGLAFAYRLNVSSKTPDFSLCVTPSSLGVPAGGSVPLTIHVLRKNGFNGDIKVSLKDAPEGFMLQGGLVPSGKDSIRATLRAPFKATSDLITLNVEGTVTSGDKVITRKAIAAEDMMQAFLYRHLVPSQELAVIVQKSFWNSASIDARREPVNIPAGGSAKVYLNCRIRQPINTLKELGLQLQNAPDGISISNVMIRPERLSFTLTAESKIEKGFADNLIVELYREFKDAPAANKKRSMGVIPAIPIVITAQAG